MWRAGVSQSLPPFVKRKALVKRETKTNKNSARGPHHLRTVWTSPKLEVLACFWRAGGVRFDRHKAQPQWQAETSVAA